MGVKPNLKWQDKILRINRAKIYRKQRWDDRGMGSKGKEFIPL
jgi:hypothetical protein